MVKYEQFGARDDGGRIRFEVFIPGPRDYEPDRGGDAHIDSISVYGTFQAQLTGTNWDQGNALPLGAYTYSRLMSWVAVERAIRIARQRGLPADLPRWTAVRDRIYNQIMQRGWHPGRRAFVQHYDTDVLDASLLLMPLCKFITPTDPRWISTLDAITAELVSDSLVYRYNVDVSLDGLAGQEATFSLCSFWWVEALAWAGRLDEARLAFEKMLTYTNHVGLYSEEIGRTGEQLGNFPQAFTHLALISAAYNLDRQLG